MTHDRSVQVLAEALDAANLAPSVEIDGEGWPVISADDDRQMLLVSPKSILAASPTLAAALDLGLKAMEEAGIIDSAGTSSANTDTMLSGSGRVLVPPAGAASRLED